MNLASPALAGRFFTTVVVLGKPLYIYVHIIIHKEKEMVKNSSVLAWRIPQTGEPGGL